MQIQEFDAYALRSYSFAVRKTNNHFTFATVALSLVIIALSLLINQSTIQHLWLPTEQLPPRFTRTLAYPKPLTSTLACFTSKSRLPKVRLYDSSLNSKILKSISQQEAKILKPELVSQIRSNFSCIDLESLSFFRGNKQYTLQIQDNQTQLYIQTVTLNSILGLQQQTLSIFQRSINKDQGCLVKMSFLQCTIEDSILSGQAPLYVNSFKKTLNFYTVRSRTTPIQSNYDRYILEVTIPPYAATDPNLNYNLQIAKIQRFDLGFIIGSVLSWISIFGLLFGTIVSPIMDKALSLLQAQTLFHIPVKYKQPSFTKFMISSIKSGIFQKEDHYVKLCDQLESLKDAELSIKLSKTLQKISSKAQKVDINQIISNPSFDYIQNNDFAVNSFSIAQTEKQESFSAKSDKISQNIISKFRKAIFFYLDNGSDSISVTFDGNGYGSKLSLILTILMLGSFLCIITFTGTFTMNTTDDRYSELGLSTFDYYSLPGQFVFTSNMDENYRMLFYDGDFIKIGSIIMDKHQKCLQHLTQMQIDKLSGTYVYCVPPNTHLRYSKNPSESINLVIDNYNSLAIIMFYHFQQNEQTEDYQFIDKIIGLQLWYDPPYSYREISLQLYDIQKLGQKTHSVQSMPFQNYLSTVLNHMFGGSIIRLAPNLNRIIISEVSVFDGFENIWSFAMICFGLFLAKITKYINLRVKNKENNNLSQQKDSLCLLLAKIKGLLVGRHRSQLSTSRYYLKLPLKHSLF